NREGVARVVGRTLWHAYMTVDATVEDARVPTDAGRWLLRDTQIELVDLSASSLRFALTSLGNDDVAGAVRGWGRAGRKRGYWRCASCRGFVSELDEECNTCGGRIVGPIADPDDRLDREEELEQAEAAAREQAETSAATQRAKD